VSRDGHSILLSRINLRTFRIPIVENAKPGTNSRGRRSREEILEVASRVMAERGYAATTMSVLAAETGLPKSAIYHHFSSKGGLLTAVMERGANSFFAAMRTAHASPPDGGTPRSRMEWYLQRTGEVFLACPDFLRLHLILALSAEADGAEAPEVAAKIKQVRDEGRAYMREMIASAFAPAGQRAAAAVAAELDYFGIAGFDGSFIAFQTDPSRTMPAQMTLLAEAIATLGAARIQEGQGVR
jgi:AcrR family transcriptional regulator